MSERSVNAAAPGVLPDMATLEAARERLRDVVRPTPLHRSGWLSERVGAPVHLKLECWQVTHSFKVRGAFNAVSTMGREEREHGLVTASAGNHGLAVAHAARLHEAAATVFVPAVVAGQGTVGLEILEQLPDVREVIVPVGGGGLIAGVGAAVRAHGDRAPASDQAEGARVLGIQTTATRSMYDAFKAGHVVPFTATRTLCDGLAGETEAEAYERAQVAVDDLRLVDDARIGSAIHGLYEQEGLVAEGAGATGVAAVLEGVFPLDGPTVIVISGGNIDGEPLARILLED